MLWLLTFTTIGLGGWLFWRGLRGHFRSRFSPEPVIPAYAATRRERWTGNLDRVWMLTGALLLLAPELPASLALQTSPDGPGLAALWLWRMIVVGGLSLTAVITFLTSRAVTSTVVAGANEVAARVPSLSGRRVRRESGLADLPTDWDGLLEYDRQLTRRFLAYGHDLDLMTSHPVMRDYADPQTRRALVAMLECDRVRRSTAPVLTRDVLTTEYGKTVLAFARAMVEAEANSVRRAGLNLDPDERGRLDEAAAILAYLQTNSTTSPERQRAYEHVHWLLDQPADAASEAADLGPDTHGAPQGVSDRATADLDLGVPQVPPPRPVAHPWLDVPQRAAREAVSPWK
ncbi:MAG: hypothetical protein ACK5MT_09325 [Actinomycetales bacterium]